MLRSIDWLFCWVGGWLLMWCLLFRIVWLFGGWFVVLGCLLASFPFNSVV